MYDREQLLLAFFASPLTLPFMWAGWAVWQGISYGELQMGIGFVFAPVAYLSAAVFGVPIFLLCRGLGWRNVLVYISGGIIMGSATVLILWLLYKEWDLTMLALCAAAGALSGLMCWLILRGSNAAGRAAS